MTQHIKDCETYIGFDWFMTHMLRDKEDFEILEGFLSVLLNEDVRISGGIDRERLALALMTPQQRREYDRHIDNVRVQNDSLNTAWTEGLEEGVKQVAKTLLRLGQHDDLILSATGLTLSQLADLKSQI